MPEHDVCPEVQTTAQIPALQVWPAGQAWPHDPQFAMSVDVFLQTPLQFNCGAGHLHTPLLHICPAPQTFPQPPQLFVSVIKSLQELPQRFFPIGQAHAGSGVVRPISKICLYFVQNASVASLSGRLSSENGGGDPPWVRQHSQYRAVRSPIIKGSRSPYTCWRSSKLFPPRTGISW